MKSRSATSGIIVTKETLVTIQLTEKDANLLNAFLRLAELPTTLDAKTSAAIYETATSLQGVLRVCVSEFLPAGNLSPLPSLETPYQ